MTLRARFLCLPIVAAFCVRSVAAQPAIIVAPASASTVEIARGLGLDPGRDRARFLSEFVRILYSGSELRQSSLDALRRLHAGRSGGKEGAALAVPVPLSPALWSAAVFKRPVTSDDLVSTILGDRRAALLSYGLTALDDETLAYLEAHPPVLTQLYERSAAAFAAFGGSLHIAHGRVDAPGGEPAVPLWEGVIGASLSEPEHFVPLLFAEQTGRLAYLFDTIAALDAPNAAFALGLWISDAAVRLERFKALALITAREYREWTVEALPFARPMHDLPLLLLRVRVDARGVPTPPADRAFWVEVFGNNSTPRTPRFQAPAAGTGKGADSALEPLVDAAWLAESAGAGNMYDRGNRIDQIAFAQRVFGSAGGEGDRADVITAVRAFLDVRMLMLTLERIGIHDAATFAFAARQAAKLDTGDGNRGFWTHAQLQSALALLMRMTSAGTLTSDQAMILVRSLLAVPLDERGRYAGGLARWLAQVLAPQLPHDGDRDIESRVILGLAGPSPGDRAPRLSWEGQDYRIDPAFAERRRMKVIRQKQGGYSVDLALDLDRIARALTAAAAAKPGVAGAAVDQALIDAATALTALTLTYATALEPSVGEVLPPGVTAPKRAVDVIVKSAAELQQLTHLAAARRAARVGVALEDVVDVVLAEALLSLNYAAEIGDPAGPALLARNVALRHDFGFGRHVGEFRSRAQWAVPRQDFQPGVPWHVSGSALGLDIALARLSLKRIDADRLVGAPRLLSTERDAFAVSLNLMNAREIRDSDRDAIAAAIARGRRRLLALQPGAAGTRPATEGEALSNGGEPFNAIADQLRLDGRRRRAIRWTIDAERDRVPALFTLSEMLLLGGVAPGTNLDAWGMSALPTAGCLCVRMTFPWTWQLLAGRPQLALGASSSPDLNLQIATMFAEMGLPAALAKSVLAAAVQDFVDDAAPTDPIDWWSLSRTARSVARERLEDYVAAAASIDGVLVPDDTGDEDR
jgi:hypothetical protein